MISASCSATLNTILRRLSCYHHPVIETPVNNNNYVDFFWHSLCNSPRTHLLLMLTGVVRQLNNKQLVERKALSLC